MRAYAKVAAKKVGVASYLREGVYAIMGGPNYETIAELRLLEKLGCDAVGMSTVHEVITAVHCGMTVFAFSLITNKCIMDYDVEDEANHEEVIETGKERQDVLKDFVSQMVAHIGGKD
ncbi:hypothetical protein J437_LFUL011577 [Ladona fulva]|uniref:purine-nucleoside phosphorylase n=1 Tax=Ladona fulva TaxID=123851 RepID=A0A8K0KCG5_LADFU|nr:hypothetical protein J437_LFUL011577 [Ladona fulva]